MKFGIILKSINKIKYNKMLHSILLILAMIICFVIFFKTIDFFEKM